MADDTGNDTRDVDDISLEDVAKPKKSGKKSVAAFIVIVAIVAAIVVAYIGYSNKKEQERREAQARQEQHIAQINSNIADAITRAEAGDLDGAVSKLQASETELGGIVTAANEEGNPDTARQALLKETALKDALQAIQAQRDQLKATVDQQMANLRTQFGITPSAAPSSATEAPAAPAGAAPAQPETPAQATEQPAAPEAPTAAVPAGPAAPPAPAPAP